MSEDQLESLVDRNGLWRTIFVLSTICQQKAQHLRANWQDDSTAKVWEKAERIIDKAADKLRELNI